jgi:hypothetical protein
MSTETCTMYHEDNEVVIDNFWTLSNYIIWSRKRLVSLLFEESNQEVLIYYSHDLYNLFSKNIDILIQNVFSNINNFSSFKDKQSIAVANVLSL